MNLLERTILDNNGRISSIHPKTKKLYGMGGIRLKLHYSFVFFYWMRSYPTDIKVNRFKEDQSEKVELKKSVQLLTYW